MDSQRFRKETSPNFKPSNNPGIIKRAVDKMGAESKATYPIDDPRYPKYASMMEDGRLVTDYKSHCANNSGPSKYGNSVRSFLQHNADAIVQVSRKRQADRAGAQFYMANTTIQPTQYQKCDEYECEFSVTGAQDSLGLERSEGCPSLFGTFSDAHMMAPSPRIPLTTVFEGGRNTPRGREYVPLGLKGFSPRDSKYGSSG